jgi:hypothetical protein|tara:strand:+ start:933 stop:1457 length:525 start_codon:yes stop_codon:yes gene_type:complete
MPIREEIPLEAPIAGMSMTHELGARPWQTPPKQTTVQEVIAHYIERMQDDSLTEQIVNILQSDIPVTTLANTIQLAGVMEGRHSIDTGMLVLPVIMEMIMLIADAEGIEYQTGMERDKETEVKDSRIMAGMAKARKEILADQKLDSNETDNETERRVDTEEMLAELPKGLMGRR